MDAREVVADAEEEGAGAVVEDHRLMRIRYPASQATQIQFGGILLDENFHSAISRLRRSAPGAAGAATGGYRQGDTLVENSWKRANACFEKINGEARNLFAAMKDG